MYRKLQIITQTHHGATHMHTHKLTDTIKHADIDTLTNTHTYTEIFGNMSELT